VTFKQDQHRTMAETAAEQLHQAIISGDVPAGAHLRLVDLAEKLGMSPMPVREALRRLESLGLVEVHPHRGAFVREVSRADFQDTMDIRIMLERAAVERAAESFTTEAAEKARDWLDRYVALAESGLVVEAREAHTELHFTLYRASGSYWLVHSIEAVWRNSERYRFAVTPHHGDPALHREHDPILEACIAQDPARAGEALVEHLTRASERMLANIPAREAGGSDES
jgi:DNA-binding GntR family transcriptional regulator